MPFMGSFEIASRKGYLGLGLMRKEGIDWDGKVGFVIRWADYSKAISDYDDPEIKKGS
jgi:hypothetical protein